MVGAFVFVAGITMITKALLDPASGHELRTTGSMLASFTKDKGSHDPVGDEANIMAIVSETAELNRGEKVFVYLEPSERPGIFNLRAEGVSFPAQPGHKLSFAAPRDGVFRLYCKVRCAQVYVSEHGR
jgi:hypothetical protein